MALIYDHIMQSYSVGMGLTAPRNENATATSTDW